MNKIVEWLLYSSKDPKKISLTIKGALTYLIPVATLFISPEDVDGAVAAIESVVFYVFMAVASVMTLYGFVRKIVNSFRSS